MAARSHTLMFWFGVTWLPAAPWLILALLYRLFVSLRP
jgi:hypothetical protein